MALPYSPELNPDEYVWNDLKNHGIGREVITSATQMREAVLSHLHQLQKLPDIVAGLFRTPTACVTTVFPYSSRRATKTGVK